MDFIKKYWKILVYVVSVVAAFIFGALAHPGTVPGGVNVTNTNAGNQIIYLTNFTEMTNNITNTLIVWSDYLHYSADPFVFVQRDNIMSVSLWKRSASQEIEQWQSDSGPFIGPTVSTRLSPGLMGGYQWKNLGIFGQAEIETNWSSLSGRAGLIWFFK